MSIDTSLSFAQTIIGLISLIFSVSGAVYLYNKINKNKQIQRTGDGGVHIQSGRDTRIK